MSRRAVAVVVAGLITAGAGSAVAYVELVDNPFEPPPPPATLNPMPAAEAESAPTVLAAAKREAPPAAEIAATLDDAIAQSDLDGRIGVIVTDLTTAEVLYEQSADLALTPASTLKLLVAGAVLEVLGPDVRFTTSVVPGESDDEIVLVGGGDPTLFTADPLMRESTSLAELAKQTAAVLRESGVDQVALGFDDSMFSGPSINPAWRSTYVSTGVAAPVTALAVDGGRTRPGFAARASDPALAAATAFADLLSAEGVTVEGPPARVPSRQDAAPLVVAESAPVSDIVEYVIASSNNDMAEILARHVAIGLGRPGSSEEASSAVVAVLAEMGIDTSEMTILDGSGLARGNAVPARALTDLLGIAADPANAHLRAVIIGLPVAAFNGTLRERVEDAPGQVRAKTGTLTGVHSLAGVVTGDGGVAYAFALLSNDAGNALEARVALDEVAASLAGCGCATPTSQAG
ncbi:MAG TPA: D-alanyl-D-alanine carboxypeptidase/D-alanyl-D-alanine-endopeptidase [Jiangellaceae bacterium]